MDLQPPRDGWWPEEWNAPVTQMLFRNGRPIAQVIRQAEQRWRAYSMLQVNTRGTGGQPLGNSCETRAEARERSELYANQLAPEVAS